MRLLYRSGVAVVCVVSACVTAFVAAPSAGAVTATLAAVGDIACAPGQQRTGSACHQAGTAALVQNLAPTAVAVLGDNQYDNGTLAEYQGSYAQSWGPLSALVRPVPGNHEYNTLNATGYFSYFGPAAQDPTKGYYSYNLGDWHVLALNANCSIVACQRGSLQEQFVRADLAANRTACTLAYWHQPLFSTAGQWPGTRDIWRDLDAFKNDVVLSGHVHRYERYAQQDALGNLNTARGSRQIIVGTGGKNLRRPGNPTKANLEALEARSFGVIQMTLRPGSYSWRFVSEAPSTFTDTGTTACHDKIAPIIRSLTLSPSSFRAARRGASLAAVTGTTLRWRLSERSTLLFTIERAATGRLVGASCVPVTRANSTAKACTRYVVLPGSFAATAGGGLTRKRFSGRLAARKLPPARYRLRAVPTDTANNVGTLVRVGFTIVA